MADRDTKIPGKSDILPVRDEEPFDPEFDRWRIFRIMNLGNGIRKQCKTPSCGTYYSKSFSQIPLPFLILG
jgi:hypothetical protein